MTIDQKCKITTFYKKAVIYFKADIAYSDSYDLQQKSDDFETEICLDLDNLHSGNLDYDFCYNGISDVSDEDIPNWIFD